MMVDYRKILATAFGDPANDGWREPAPACVKDDKRALEERVEQREMIMNEETVRPTLDELHDLSGVPWMGDAGYDPMRQARPTLVRSDRGGVTWRHLGGLEFINGAFLYRYGDLDGSDPRKVKKPIELRSPRRPKSRAHVNIVPTSGSWTLEDQIDARQQVRTIWDRMPASSIRILEHALGSTTASELGAAFRKQGKTAERLGVRLIDRAIDHLRDAWRPQIALCA